MKTIIWLRFTAAAFFLAVLLCTASALLIGKSISLQTKILDQPNYLALFSQGVADNVYHQSGLPVGVFADQGLLGCQQERNNLKFLPPLGLAQGHYDVDQIWGRHFLEVRYSTEQQQFCAAQVQEVYTAPFSGKKAILSPTLDVPNTPEYLVSSFTTDEFHNLQQVTFWNVTGIHLQKLAFEQNGLESLNIAKTFPGWDIASVKASFCEKVKADYRVRGELFSYGFVKASLIFGALGLGILGQAYISFKNYARDGKALRLSAQLDASAYKAVELAGKVAFFNFCLRPNLWAYAETVALRQREAWHIFLAWTESQNSLNLKPEEPLIQKPQTNGNGNGNGSSKGMTREKRLAIHVPRIKQSKDVVKTAKQIVTAATKGVEAQQFLKGFQIDADLLPSDIPRKQVEAITAILKTLLSGSEGIPCFSGDPTKGRRLGSEDLRRRVMFNNSDLAAVPRSYEKGLAWLVREGVVNKLNESGIETYAISTNADMVSEATQGLRSSLIAYNQKRRGFSR